ncbi:MBL fold metallo-hydrolase [Chlorobaculum thiosulfatiphilum]|uniref:MBL fold metallo-hydrolase n=1 Tax=Chlorobaculum thiosulfatiphilum TaxID=115852 RepID=A0A5C4RZX9_CHLTI|nr:MBL fold metallo-hydrolase [Chlorobaculum thiosulfatiphilum]TNJ36816.1 MBL fold metallo-hydrolase [Chlorobaculum thiosulfatiphilum]
MKLTILTDNHAAPGLACEHGFAVLIDTGGKRILFDTGQLTALDANCRSLGIDLAGIDMIVLSHGHYDHTGNLADVLRIADRATLYLHPSALVERYSIRNGKPKPIDMPESAKRAIDQLPAGRIRWVTEPLQLTDGVFLTGPIPRNTAFEDTGGPFFFDPEGQRPDPIEDDLSLWIEEPEGLTVLAGCCHSGIVNTLDHIEAQTGPKRIARLIGGLHLAATSPERLERTVEALEKRDIQRLIPCHCTGQPATELFRRELRCPVEAGYAGMVVETGKA